MRVQLTDVERLVKGTALAKSASDLGTLKADKAAAVADFGKAIKAQEALQSRLVYDLQTGTEVRDVAVEERMRYREMCVDLVRADNGETIETRPMTAEERQTRFNLVPLHRSREPEPEPEDEPEPVH
jgi:hypothetical protein